MAYSISAQQPELHDVVARLLLLVRQKPASMRRVLLDLDVAPEALADILTDGDIAGGATVQHPAYGPWSSAVSEGLELATVLAHLAQTTDNQMVTDFVAGEWMAVSLNSTAWVDTLVLIRALASGQVASGWGSGFAPKMTAVWNMIEVDSALSQARLRLCWMRAVSFGAAPEMARAADGVIPTDLPRNGSLLNAITDQAAKVAKDQAVFDRARRGIEAALLDIYSTSPAYVAAAAS
ncbi:MAG: hypothetical protein AAGA63_04575 [Pseudomonadota bacterium]